MVREDSLTLFGFLDEDEKSLFELLQTVSGVGPKLAQAMLAVLPPDDLRAAVAGEDVETLTRVPGIGQKGAQRIILELKDRLGAPTGPAAPAPPRRSPAAGATRSTKGLVGLGWSVREAEQAVDAVAPGRGAPRRGGSAARSPAFDEQGMTVPGPEDRLVATRGGAPALAHRCGRRRGRAHDRGRPAAPQPGRVRRPVPGAGPARPGAGGRPPARPVARPRPALAARPGWARPRWP